MSRSSWYDPIRWYPSDEPQGGKSTKASSFLQRLGMLLCTVVVALAILTGIFYGVWRLILVYLSPGFVAIWAIITTLLVPIAAWGGMRYGQIEGRGVVSGLGAGIGGVMKAANDTANLKVTMGRQVRGVPEQPPAMPQLVDVTPRVVRDEWQ